jgi:hypothetical protein
MMGVKLRTVGAERWTQRQGETRTREGMEHEKREERQQGPTGRAVGQAGEGPTLSGLGYRCPVSSIRGSRGGGWGARGHPMARLGSE